MVTSFVEPGPEHVQALKRYKTAFMGDDIPGSCGLRRASDIEEWVNQKPYTLRGSRCYILYDEDTNVVLGTCRLSKDLTTRLVLEGGYNFGYSVHPKARRKGYGRQIILECAKQAQQLGMSELLMEADADNYASWKCMESAGAVRVQTVLWKGRLHYMYKLEV